MGHRKDLQITIDIEVSGIFIAKDKEKIQANIERRAKLKINQPRFPESYYADCYVNSEEYKAKNR